ncbi:theronine dehydrogenase [Bacillus sp. FJAT-27225]|uniref:zinc-dependent alcohol dehydrogenase family protein n=1 Tax=Bacillus sp. FJAT-27225 TaxID=1743144 RepID=UPI00080C2DAC|nr:zinc-dependent alcohol dehydrogenase family protein [Bacillus sp. FJAT-27225]OCA87842.1 theronine dehydrogenase [Bacillus sp. FJAT-27225]
MKAAILTGIKQIEFMDTTMPKLVHGEVVINVKSCGICGTDKHIYHGEPGSAAVIPPRILGHELAGEVVEIGTGVTTLKKGDRVTIDPNIYCGTCHYCRNNRVNLCENMQAIGVTRDGGMGEYCVAPAANCYVIPDSITFEEAALVEPLGCVLHGFKKVELSTLSRVLIIGGGFIGQLFLQLVKGQNVASVVVSEPSESKKDLLYQLGADEVINPLDNHPVEADVVIECVGKKESMEAAFRSAAKGGQVLLFGVASPETAISVFPYEIFSKELTIKGSFVNPYTHEEAIALIANRVIDVQSLISHQISLEELPSVMADYPSLSVSKAIVVNK